MSLDSTHDTTCARSTPHIGAYYFPNYHLDPRNEAWHGQGWTEWELVKRAEPRWDGHWQPRMPLLGYEDEADPEVMGRKMDVALTHGVDVFLFDWYWYDGRPYLERPLEEAFLPQAEEKGMQFALMWANHDWANIHPWKRATPRAIQEVGSLDADQFREATDYITDTYLRHPSYLRIDDRPVLQIYDLPKLIEGLGGVEGTRAALDDLRRRVAAAGAGELHLNAIAKGLTVLPQESTSFDGPDLVDRLGFDSVTSYVWVHHHELPELETDYITVVDEAAEGWAALAERYPVPYYPNVTVGWDSSPRTVQSDLFDPEQGYPHTNVLVGTAPEAFGRALEAAQEYLERTGAPLLTINAWNEWTEGTYLEPDTVHGYGHLEQILRVFGPRGAHGADESGGRSSVR